MIAPQRDVRMRFVLAPFLPEHQPALGVSTLAAVLRREGVEVGVRYLNIEYRSEIGWYTYLYLSQGLPTEMNLGEMVFVPALWGEGGPEWSAYEKTLRADFRRFCRSNARRLNGTSIETILEETFGVIADRVQKLRVTSAATIRRWADEVLRDRPRIVGFSTSFQQNIASLALAQELRRRAGPDELAILFGGANCEADMGAALAENFAFIDHVVSGEVEGVLPALVRSIVDRNDRFPRFIEGEAVRDLDALPLPEFEEYFTAIKGTDLDGTANLVAESSRGCWWGAKSPCAFCGLNGEKLAYRSKTSERFVEEICELGRRHPGRGFMMTDNMLDTTYLTRFFPKLIASGEERHLFYETKSNLRKDQMELMAAAGVKKIQPGIESLSTHTLNLIGKGTSRLQNVQLLKWGAVYHIALRWNILLGFPGELPQEYDSMAELVPLLVHLPPPTGCTKMRLDRFSPYWKNPVERGLVNVRRFWSYDWLYHGLPAAQRDRMAYFFDYDYADGRDPASYAGALIAAVNGWWDASVRRATLELATVGGVPAVIDTRVDGSAPPEPVDANLLRLLRILESPRRTDAARAAFDEAGSNAQMGSPFDQLLVEMQKRRWVISENETWLSLMLDRSESDRVALRRAALQLDDLGIPLAEDSQEISGIGISVRNNSDGIRSSTSI